MNKFEYVNASTLKAAGEQLGGDWSARVKAGGIDLLDELKERIIAPQRLINLRSIKGLDEIKPAADGGLTIGPLVTLARIAADSTIRSKFLALAEAAGGAATPQIRNVATIGGNLAQRPRCWYYRNEEFHCLKKGGDKCFAHDGDNRFHALFGNEKCAIVHPSATAVALVALDAKLKITGKQGERVIEIEKFFITPEQDILRENILKPSEVISEIILPAWTANARSFYHKQKEKQSFDWPLADTAVVLEIAAGKCKQARIVMGAAAPIPWRATAAEQQLIGKPIDVGSATAAAKAAIAGAKPLTQNGYKLPLFEAIIARAILSAAVMRA